MGYRIPSSRNSSGSSHFSAKGILNGIRATVWKFLGVKKLEKRIRVPKQDSWGSKQNCIEGSSCLKIPSLWKVLSLETERRRCSKLLQPVLKKSSLLVFHVHCLKKRIEIITSFFRQYSGPRLPGPGRVMLSGYGSGRMMYEWSPLHFNCSTTKISTHLSSTLSRTR